MLPRKLTCAFEKSHHAELVMIKTVVIKQENGEIFRIDQEMVSGFPTCIFFGIYCNL